MPPKKATGKGKKPAEPPKPVPDLEWEDVPEIATSLNSVYNQKIKIRLRSLFSVVDVSKRKKLDFENTLLFLRAAGLFPTDQEAEEWFKGHSKKEDGDEVAFIDRDTLCDGTFEVNPNSLLRQGHMKPPSPKQAVRYWRRLDMAQKGSLNPEDLTNIFAQEERVDGMTPTELKKLLKYVSTLPGGELDYAAYCDHWYKIWMSNRIPRPRDRMPRRQYDDTV